MCSGCIHAVTIRDGVVGLCPFCRTPTPTPDEMIEQCKNKRMEVDDAYAIHNVGCCYGDGLCGCLPQDHAKAKVQLMFMNGDATKHDYAKALSVYQTNLVEIKRSQRDEAAAFDDDHKYY